MPVLGPITPGSPEEALDEPSDDEVMRALEKARPVQGGLPCIDEVQRNNVRIVKRADCRLHRSAAGVSAGRSGPTPSRPLQVHRLLYRDDLRGLADPVHQTWMRTARKWSTSTTTICTWSATSTPGPAPAIERGCEREDFGKRKRPRGHGRRGLFRVTLPAVRHRSRPPAVRRRPRSRRRWRTVRACLSGRVCRKA